MKRNFKNFICICLIVLIGLCGCSNGENTKEFDADMEISVVSREDGSGTRGAFIELVGIEEKDLNGNKVDRTTISAVIAKATDVMLSTVSSDEYAIGYVSLGSLSESVKAISVNGVEASIENIKNGTYEIARPFNVAYKGTLNDAAQDFMNFILSAEGQSVVENAKYIKVDDNASTFVSSNVVGKIVVGGSSSVTPVMEKLKEAYIAINPNVTIEINASDSSTGMKEAISGVADIGMASRDLKESELAELTPLVIATDGIAVIVNPINSVKTLTKEQIKSIFVGDTTIWSEVQ